MAGSVARGRRGWTGEPPNSLSPNGLTRKRVEVQTVPRETPSPASSRTRINSTARRTDCPAAERQHVDRRRRATDGPATRDPTVADCMRRATAPPPAMPWAGPAGAGHPREAVSPIGAWSLLISRRKIASRPAAAAAVRSRRAPRRCLSVLMDVAVLASLRNSVPITSVITATTIGYHRP